MEKDPTDEEIAKALQAEEITKTLQAEELAYWMERERTQAEREKQEKAAKAEWDAWFMAHLPSQSETSSKKLKELKEQYDRVVDKERERTAERERAYLRELERAERFAREEELERERAKKGYLGNTNTHSLHVVGGEERAEWVPCRRPHEERDEFLQYAAGVFTADGIPVQPIRYQARDEQTVFLVLRRRSKAKVKKIALKNLFLAEQNGTLEDWRAEQVAQGVTRVEIPVKALLDCIHGTPNSSVLTAIITFSDDEQLKTAIPLFIVQQKLIVLLPGVLASTIHVREKDGARFPAWLPPVLAKIPLRQAAYMAYLACDESGRPEHEACDLRFVSVFNEGDGPYFTKKWQGLVNGSLPFPRLRFGEVPLDYLLIQEYPYDWRYDAGDLVDILLGDLDRDHVGKEDLKLFIGHHDPRAWNTSMVSEIMSGFQGANPHARFKSMVSLKTVLRALKLWGNPFLDDQVAVAGHSTGGVVLNGLIRDPRAKGIVDGAFFIATPFFGALKSYTAFLTGEMDLPGAAEYAVFNRAAFVKMAPNMPVLYALAPTKDYRKKIGTVIEKDGKETHYFVPDVGKFLSIVIETIERHQIEPHVVRRGWNPTLHQKAQEYQEKCTQRIAIPTDNIAVYYSEAAGATRGRLVCDLRDQVDGSAYPPDRFFDCGHGRLFNEKVKGDQTVPLESLVGPKDFQGKLKKLSGEYEHVKICESEEMWRHMGSLLAHNLWQVSPEKEKEK